MESLLLSVAACLAIDVVSFVTKMKAKITKSRVDIAGVDNLWNAYAALEKSKVRGASAPHILTDPVSLVRFAMHQENEFVPFPEKVQVNFNAWMAQQEVSRRGHGSPRPDRRTETLARNDPRSQHSKPKYRAG